MSVLAVIRPDPSMDPVLLARKANPDWTSKEAGLFVPPRSDQIDWYFKWEKTAYRILDREKFRQAAMEWPRAVEALGYRLALVIFSDCHDTAQSTVQSMDLSN